MDSPVSDAPSAERLAAVETIALELVPRTSLIARLLLRRTSSPLSRAEAQVANDRDWAGQWRPALLRARLERPD